MVTGIGIEVRGSGYRSCYGRMDEWGKIWGGVCVGSVIMFQLRVRI